MASKKTLLMMADRIEEAARSEEIGWITLVDVFGRFQTVHRYDLPHIAEGMRIQAQLMDLYGDTTTEKSPEKFDGKWWKRLQGYARRWLQFKNGKDA